MARNRIHRIHKVMMLDFAGIVPMRSMPKKVEEVNSLVDMFRLERPEEYKRAYRVIVLHQTDSADPTEIMASKVSEIVKSNLIMQESDSINKITNAMQDSIKKAGEEVKQEARDEIEKAKKQFVTHQIKIGNSKAKKIKGVVPKQFDKLLQLGQMRKNILMVGPAGCGKTYIAEQIANGLSLDFMSQSCSEGVSESVFTGRLLPVGKGGRFEYVTSQFVRMYEEGGVFLLDEFDASDPNVAVFLNQALAGHGFTLELRADNPWVKKHKDFLCVACANTFGNGSDAQYVGRNQMDAATMDRFKIGTVAMDYDEEVERAIIETRSADVYSWGVIIRNAITDHGLKRIMSTRVMQDACDMVIGQDWDLDDVNNSYFSDWSREELRVIHNAITTAGGE